MILVDTSVWINHFRKHDQQLANFLQQGLVVCHPLVVGELACGNLHNHHKIVALLNSLEMVEDATNILGSDQKKEMIFHILCLFSGNYRFNQHLNLIITIF